MENKKPEIAQKVNVIKASKEMEDFLKKNSLLNDLRFRLIEEWYNVRCFWIRCAGYGVVVLVTLLIAMSMGGFVTTNKLFEKLADAKLIFVFDLVKDGKIFSREFHIPFEVFLLLALSIWRFSPASFSKNKSKSDSTDDSLK